MSYQQGGYGGDNYNPYGQHANPYQDNPYGGQQNPYDQRDDYGGRPMQPQVSSNYGDPERGQGGYEMSNMNGTDPNRLLNECRNIDRAIDELDQQLDRLHALHMRALDDVQIRDEIGTSLSGQVAAANSETMQTNRELVQRVKKLKSDPESGNPRNAPQVGKVDRRLKTTINQYQQLERDHRKRLRDRSIREYRVVRPDASEAEVNEAVESGEEAIFSQALINSDRRGQAQNIADAAHERHKTIKKIEEDMATLAQLFNDLDAQVIQQEPAVTQIEQRGEEVTDHVAKANTELEGAVDKARAARKKKWMCFGLVVLIIIIIAVVVAVAVSLTNK